MSFFKIAVGLAGLAAVRAEQNHFPGHAQRDGKASADGEASVNTHSADSAALENMFSALAVLQNDYFNTYEANWPKSIEWTGAVVETVVAGTLTTLTTSLPGSGHNDNWKDIENLISFYYDQVASYYFGQDAEEIKREAYDDMSWVVLGWIEAIKFVEKHSSVHYGSDRQHQCKNGPTDLAQAIKTASWHGYTSYCSFADRAHTFYQLSQKGWDTTLCHGGMVWNDRLPPYKNAITNELYISTSVSMYQRFPGNSLNGDAALETRQGQGDPSWLQASQDGYNWLSHVNMTNDQGLYTDGFHVDMSKPGNVECDQRDEMVYTYNQGVVLTGLRGLWEVTGESSYVDDGHKLIKSVIAATGWDLDKNAPSIGKGAHSKRAELPPWKGLGRGGILEEKCDAEGTCSQDAQTFKGIFFHHFNRFCEPVPRALSKRDRTTQSHTAACKSYLGWIKHNADAALKTRDGNGHFGMWWGAGVFANAEAAVAANGDGINHKAVNATDYRNHGTPENNIWGERKWTPGISGGGLTGAPKKGPKDDNSSLDRRADDPNDRGRGRTVETQTGGLSVVRAYYELSRLN